MITRDLGRRPEDADDVWANVAEVAAEVEAELDVLVRNAEDRVVARIQAAQGALSPTLQDALRRALAAAVRDTLARLRSASELPQELPPDLLELARLSADPQYELTGLADGWLLAGEVFWDRFQVVAERTLPDTAVCWDVVKAARVRLTGHAARASELFRNACETEVARAAGIDEERGLRAVTRALEGEWLEPGDLGYDLADHHVAIVADAPEQVVGLARRAQRPLLLVKAPDAAMWGWLGGRSRIADSDLDALIASLDPRDGQVVFGEPAEGIAGFAASHHQALEARAIAAATNQPAVRFADMRLLIALLPDTDLARGFIERELGELDDPSERMGELRETLRSYLEHGQSVSATAAVRHRDRKTIERQLRTAEQMINHRVSDRCDELLIALRIADILRYRT